MLDDVTREYFEIYLGGSLSGMAAGELRVYQTTRRSTKEEGWGYTVAVWVFLLGDCGVISVRPDLKDRIGEAVASLENPRAFFDECVQQQIQSVCGEDFATVAIDILSCRPDQVQLHSCPGCRRMAEADVECYLTFQKAVSPACDLECCRTDILRNIRDGIAVGVFRGGKMVSNASAPHIAHMQDIIEEAGVETLPDYRKQGYGKAALSHCTKAILDLGRVPIYRLSKSNIASLRTAESVGYRRIAESILFRTRR